MYIKGIAKIDSKTKKLIKRLNPGDIAVIDHEDIDELAATGLVSAKVRAVVNAAKSITGRYPTPGPAILVRAGIPIVDNVGKKVMSLREGCEISITGDGSIFCDGGLVAQGEMLTMHGIDRIMKLARVNMENSLDKFIDNTLEYAKKEKYLIMGGVEIPQIKTAIKGKHVLIVVRGSNYKEDLAAIRTYIAEVKPVLVGVDGGADAIMEFGYRPDIIIGDMDSVSDEALKVCREIVVHAYPDGRAPGLKRIEELGLSAHVFKAPGTSEDIAMLLAYEKGADLLVAVGTHSSMLDFLEKGRNGMASTFLVRLKVGSKLVDAKGASKLYNQKMRPFYVVGLLTAAMIPVMVISLTSPLMQNFLKLLELRIRMLIGY
ncbi:MAG: hypothetical protein PWQ97_350 [Tepidanaerobacteraceae bacterium]|nr:hypothetical protein [Tepidanaerobacteraceae bacterium]